MSGSGRQLWWAAKLGHTKTRHPQWSLPSSPTTEHPGKVLQRGTSRAGEHRDHPVIGSDSTGACRFLLLQVSFYHYKFHYFEFSKAFRIFFFQAGYKKDIRITILVLTIALLKAAGQKWGALGRIKT